MGSSQFPMETDEFVAMERGRPDGWFPSGARRLLRLWPYRQLRPKKCLSKAGRSPCHLSQLLSFRWRRSLSSCWIALISVRYTVNGFVTPRGNTRFSRFPSTGYKDISLHLHANRLTGFQSHCQSLNLCLSVAECLSEYE